MKATFRSNAATRSKGNNVQEKGGVFYSLPGVTAGCCGASTKRLLVGRRCAPFLRVASDFEEGVCDVCAHLGIRVGLKREEFRDCNSCVGAESSKSSGGY